MRRRLEGMLLVTALVIAGVVVLAPRGGAVSASACTSGQLRVANGPYAGGASQEEAHTLAITNVSPGACALEGYISIRPVDPSGRTMKLPVSHHPSGSYAFSTRPPRPVVVAAHGTADVLFVQMACVEGYLDQARVAAITLPVAGSPVRWLRLATPLARCRGAYGASEDMIAVTPIEPSVRATEL